jgi:hypothetical protein
VVVPTDASPLDLLRLLEIHVLLLELPLLLQLLLLLLLLLLHLELKQPLLCCRGDAAVALGLAPRRLGGLAIAAARHLLSRGGHLHRHLHRLLLLMLVHLLTRGLLLLLLLLLLLVVLLLVAGLACGRNHVAPVHARKDHSGIGGNRGKGGTCESGLALDARFARWRAASIPRREGGRSVRPVGRERRWRLLTLLLRLLGNLGTCPDHAQGVGSRVQ